MRVTREDLFTFLVGYCVGFLVCCIFAFGIAKVDQDYALAVYRGETTLEITYRDGVAVDSTVVFRPWAVEGGKAK